MYLTLPSNALLTGFFPSEIEGSSDRSQRPLDPTHARRIKDYILDNPTAYALGALVYAVDKEGVFEEVLPGTGIGVLRLPLDAKLRSIDGQHRREGLRQSIATVPELQSQSTAVVVYVEPDLAERRQMFSDMNTTARKVSKTLGVSFDSRDPFARAATALSDTHPLLTGRVDRTNPRVLSGSGDIYTLSAVHDALKRLFVGPVGRVKDTSKFDEGAIYTLGGNFFDVLATSRPELTTTSPADIDGLRGRSIILSSTTLRVLASAVWTASQALDSIESAIEALAKALPTLDFEPYASIWQETGFVSPGHSTPNARSQEMKSASDALASLLLETSQSNRSNGDFN